MVKVTGALTRTMLLLALAFGSGAASAMATDNEATQPDGGDTAAENGGAGTTDDGAGDAGEAEGTGTGGVSKGDGQGGGQQSDILSTLQQQGQFSQTVDAIERAGLSDTLSGPGPFTFLAPTDQAWSKLSTDQRDNLMGDISRLRRVLSYHVVPDEIRMSDIQQMGSVTTIQGQPLQISGRGGQITVNDIKVTKAPIQATNGVVYAIGGVLMPTARQY